MIPRRNTHALLLMLCAISCAGMERIAAQETGEIVRSGGVEIERTSAPSDEQSIVLPLPERREFPVAPASFAEPIVREERALASSEESKNAVEPNKSSAIPLGTKRVKSRASASNDSRPSSTNRTLLTVGSSLAIVLGLFFMLALLTRRGMKSNVGRLPGEIIETLGKAPLAKGQELQLVRIGSKLLLINVTQHGSETLTEFTNPEEVDRISAVCRREHPAGMSAVFRKMLSQLEEEPVVGGFAGNDTRYGAEFRA